jgi:PPOX class probable F420-dependent enzyme
MGSSGPRTDALAQEEVAWIASVRPDGRPHLVPLWFCWDGDAIVVFSKADAQKVRNLARDPRAMVAVGEAGADMRIDLLEAVAELGPPPVGLPDTFVDKYRDRLTHLGLSVQRFAETYPLPIRLRPTRWLEWGGPGWANSGERVG